MSNTKKIYILMGNPDMQTLSKKMADAYEAGALEAGHEVRRQNLPEMKFDQATGLCGGSLVCSR